jgi:RecQ-mediated genome instability protein 1
MSEEPDLDIEIDGERRPSAAERNTLAHAAAAQNNATSHHFSKNNSKRDLDDVNVDVEILDFNFPPTTRQATRLYRPSPSTSLDVPLKVQLQRRRQQPQDKSFDFDLLDEIDPDQNRPPAPVQQKPSSAALPPRDLKGKGRAEPCSPFVDQSKKSLSKIDDASSDDYGMMGIDDNDFADVEFLENLDRVEMEALASGDTNGAHAPSAAGVMGLSSSSVSMGGSFRSGSSYLLVDDDKKKSVAVSAPMASSSSSTKSNEQLEIIEISSSDEDDEMLGTDDKENEPVATRHVKRRTEDLDEGGKERGRGLFASQGWNPLLSGGGTSGVHKTGALGSQSQNRIRGQNGNQGLKARVPATRADVIDLSDSDDDV